ncbi:MAG: TrmB family transcriptional regulator [Candidatus Nanoarchaeia archaeon]
METKLLEELGLTKNEVKVYLALLELGTTSAGPLIKKTEMHRAAVYDLLEFLIDKGLVSFVIKANRKYFEAQDPSRLTEYLNEKKQELMRKEIELKQLIPLLREKRVLSHEEQEGTVFKGKKGLKSVFEDILKEKSSWFVFGATGQFKELFPAYFIHFHKRRSKLNILLKIIFNENIRKTHREKELENYQIKYIPESHITPSTTYVYGDKVAIILWSKEPMAFVMRSKQVAESYKTFFNLLWEIAKK